jgi:hypothetical protein
MRQHTRKWKKSGLLIDSIDSKQCKTVLDQIDQALARHYGLTDAERDYIINYDLKYRLSAA